MNKLKNIPYNKPENKMPLLFENLCEYNLYEESDADKLVKLGKALSSPIRLNILRQLHGSALTITQISKRNKLANSTTIFHLKILEAANLISISYTTSKHGEIQLVKTENKTFLLSDIPSPTVARQTFPVEQSCPVGLFEDATTDTYFTILIGTDIIRLFPSNLFDPIRAKAERFFTTGGSATYAFSNSFAKQLKVAELRFSFEISSEITSYSNDWKSDVTFAVNGKDIATYTCPGDYGGAHGRFTPAEWPDRASQYGDLVTVTVRADGTYLNNCLCSAVTLNDLAIEDGNKLHLTIYNKKDALNYGGFNLFGKGWGNYDQDILCTAICCEK